MLYGFSFSNRLSTSQCRKFELLMAQFALVGVGACTAFAGAQCYFTYQYVYNAARYILKYDFGYDWHHSSNKQQYVLAAGSAAAALTGVGVFASFKYALDRILLAKRPDAGRLLDKMPSIHEQVHSTFVARVQ